jgi:hypothetical protein
MAQVVQEMECKFIVNVGGSFVCCVVKGTQKSVRREVWNRVYHALHAAAEPDAGTE